jgi:hypothetical protein
MNERKLNKHDSALAIEVFYIDERHLEEEEVELLIPLQDE